MNIFREICEAYLKGYDPADAVSRKHGLPLMSEEGITAVFRAAVEKWPTDPLTAEDLCTKLAEIERINGIPYIRIFHDGSGSVRLGDDILAEFINTTEIVPEITKYMASLHLPTEDINTLQVFIRRQPQSAQASAAILALSRLQKIVETRHE